MCLDPKQRISAQDALDHPWFDRFYPAITLKHNFMNTEHMYSMKIQKTQLDVMLSRAQTL